MILMRAVPPELVEGVLSGAYRVTGSVVRDVASGRGVAFLQETGVLQSLLGSALKGAGATLQSGFSPLGLVAVVQNQQIKARLAQMQSSLALLQNLQVGTLAVAGLGLGVSIAGFVLLMQRLKGIETHLQVIEAKIEQTTKDRRADETHMIFADIRTQLATIDSLAARSNKLGTAEASEQALSQAAGRLGVHFERQVRDLHEGRATPADLEMLWALASAIRICHEAGLRALFIIDELQAAAHLAQERAKGFLALGQDLSPDTLARLCALGQGDALSYGAARQAALPQSEVLVRGLRDSVASIASQAELALHLRDVGTSGPAYLADLAAENEAALVALPL